MLAGPEYTPPIGSGVAVGSTVGDGAGDSVADAVAVATTEVLGLAPSGLELSGLFVAFPVDCDGSAAGPTHAASTRLAAKSAGPDRRTIRTSMDKV